MLAFCVCPAPAAIGAIPAFTCGEEFGQIQKIVFQRRQAAATFATVVAAGTLANWTTLKAAVGATKVVATPFFENFVIPGVEAITEGGDDNSTLDGTALVVGRTTPIATGNFRSLPGATFTALELYICEPDMTVFFINEYGQIIADSHDGTDVWGIPISEWFIGDKEVQGKNTSNKNMFRFGVRAGWTKKLKVITPVDFNARYDL